MKKTKQVISFGGYAATGGSVVRDLFKEFDGVAVFPTEFRVIKEHYGLLDLKSSLFFSPSTENTDLAIKDFQWLCANFAKGHSKIMRSGHLYDGYTNNRFSASVERFVSSIVDYTYPMSWHFYDFKKGYVEYMVHRYLKRLSKKMTFEKPAYMSTVTEKQFDTSAREFIGDVINGFLEQKFDKAAVVGLHNALQPTSVYSIEEGSKFFKTIKVIVVDRDPRDVFLDFPKKRYLPQGVDDLHRAKCFVDFFLKLREQKKLVQSRDDVLSLSFEDMVSGYDESVKSISRFVGSEIGSHTEKLKYFNPDLSKKNIGKYKNVKGETAKAVKYIESKLSDYIK